MKLKTSPMAFRGFPGKNRFPKSKICIFGGVSLIKFAFQGLNIMLVGIASTRGQCKVARIRGKTLSRFHMIPTTNNSSVHTRRDHSQSEERVGGVCQTCALKVINIAILCYKKYIQSDQKYTSLFTFSLNVLVSFHLFTRSEMN